VERPLDERTKTKGATPMQPLKHKKRLVLVALILLLVGVFVLVWGRGKSVSRLADDLQGDDAKGRRHAARELAGLGSKAKEAVPALKEALKDPDKRVRYNAAKSLSKVGSDARPATGALIDALSDSDSGTRYYAAKTLAKLKLKGEDGQAAVPGLIGTLKDSNPRTRYYAVKCLQDIGAEAKQATAALREASRDADKDVRQAATGALKKLERKK